jgi:hypothetical protein
LHDLFWFLLVSLTSLSVAIVIGYGDKWWDDERVLREIKRKLKNTVVDYLKVLSRR